jgi:hypothetical protein
MDKMLSFGKFFQIGYVTRNIDVALEHLTNVIGARQVALHYDLRDGQGNPSIVRNIALLDLGGAEVELIEPRLDWPSSIYLEALPGKETPLAFHHFGYMLQDDAAFDQAMKHVTEANMAVPFAGRLPDVRFAYIDTRPISGHYSEIVLYLTPRRPQ